MAKARAKQARLDVATAAGKALRAVVTRGPRELPGVFGAFLVVWGLHQVYEPVAYIVGGLFLLLVDRRSS